MCTGICLGDVPVIQREEYTTATSLIKNNYRQWNSMYKSIAWSTANTALALPHTRTLTSIPTTAHLLHNTTHTHTHTRARQPQRITSGPNTNFALSPLFISQVIIIITSRVLSLVIFRVHSTRKPASNRVTCFILPAYTATGVSHSQHGEKKKNREIFW